ncbi:WcbI family polysaccharide biosynthesis putative acetyltransferase [Methylobacterium haplocladii]|uniref:Polysaccharide biosynthesis enzyme WcbI domain-containing protein n=1 Tax=Methylobacterium haplocladii TaxID=1176176 RepID=A0A512IJU3_9HYPH|nr:WcbI family polysaccharide biosynthesis putative acetyltransferase [Methylobacterium haplocladii]GEO97986.1 hypothetical protein MHA02_03740 [Methylobacterium haplocladii]GJD86037.1 hypothetical protein HPGCJGGD_3934 [Methylobacterium haplocladii]GLS57887.1 hypothetical protein GCM10007887_05430 [Methylobacterium haplocladii]
MALLETGRQALQRGLALLPWTGIHRAASGRTGPRIAVIGNCQARGVARALTVLLPNARIELMPIGTLGRGRRSLKALADGLTDHDHVFTQPFLTGRFRDGGSAELVGMLPRARLFPAIVFPAFHPDMVYVGDFGAGAELALVPSPLHTYHSAIVLFGYLRGLSAQRIVRLFRQETFAALGYLDGWQLSADDLARSSRAVGVDLAPEILRWSRRGAFMHAINHPKLFVLADLAGRVARDAGLAPLDLAVDAYLVDDLLDDVIWPIYPPVAEVYGLAGSYAFKRRAVPGAAPSMLGVEGLVAESLALYDAMPRARLICHRTEHWSGAPEIRALFDAA